MNEIRLFKHKLPYSKKKCSNGLHRGNCFKPELKLATEFMLNIRFQLLLETTRYHLHMTEELELSQWIIIRY